MRNHLRRAFSVEGQPRMLTSRHPEVRDLVPVVTPRPWVLRWLEGGPPEERQVAFLVHASSFAAPRTASGARVSAVEASGSGSR